MKKTLALLVSSLCIALTAHAQITIDDFASAPGGFTTISGTWAGQVNTAGGLLTVGGTADDTGTMLYSPILGGTFDASAQTFQVSVTARIDAGNTATGFAIVFFDGNADGTRSATFSTALFSASLSTQVLTLGTYGTGNPINTQMYGIAGIGAGGPLFHMTFDNIIVSPTVVPEPSTYAMFAGALALGFVAWRRRSVSS